MTCTSFQELDKAISLLDRDLGQLAVTVENMEHVSLCHSFGRKIAWKMNIKSGLLVTNSDN